MRDVLSKARYEKKHKVYAERGGELNDDLDFIGPRAEPVRGLSILLFPPIYNSDRSRPPQGTPLEQQEYIPDSY
jgi:hypothetical protein